jgi:acyl-CoA reductase-like NAD-dependent aldehyde dehydrogenase
MVHMLINGRLVNGNTQEAVINPADETVVAQAPLADVAQVDAAVQAAAGAFKTWRHTTAAERGAVLQAISQVIVDHQAELAELLVKEQGRPLPLAHFEMGLATQYLAWYAGQTIEVDVQSDDAQRRVEIHHMPLGVVAGIVPWNAPIHLAINKIAPALMAGNTIVIKPSPTTPLTTLRLGELIAEVVPAGVVNIISGGADVGARLTTHPLVAKVSFTGSTATGKAIMASAANTLKRITLELGGNDAAVVLPGADVGSIAPALFGLSFFNSGQVCAIIKRLYVHESLYEAVCEQIAAMANAAVLGNGLDASSQFGPVQNRAQFDKVLGYIDSARRDGRIIAGGGEAQRPGYFVPLTVVRDISDGTALVDEEPFGPVLPIICYSDVDDVIERVNRSPYGLGASVWSSDLAAAGRVAAQIESGTVWINQHCALDPAVPFPTLKNSGLGVESGREGLLSYTALKVVNINKG